MNDAERVAILHRGFEAWNAGDLEGFLDLAEPDVWFRPVGAFLGLEEQYNGRDSIRDFWGAFREMWTKIEVDAEEVETIGELVFAACTFHGTGRDGIEAEATFFFVFEFRDRGVAGWWAFADRAQAIEVAERARETGGLEAVLTEEAQLHREGE